MERKTGEYRNVLRLRPALDVDARRAKVLELMILEFLAETVGGVWGWRALLLSFHKGAMHTEHGSIKILFVAGFGPIVRDMAESRKLYSETLGIHFKEESGEYLHTEALNRHRAESTSPHRAIRMIWHGRRLQA